MAQPKEKELTFEAALDKLEKAVAKLESGDLTLEQALAHFEEGIALIRRCESHLRRAEGKLRELLEGENGELIERIVGTDLSSLLAGEQSDDQPE